MGRVLEPRTSEWTAKRRARNRRGWLAEIWVAAMLMAKGYRVLGRRVRTGAGEIDLVVRRGDRLVFVEVKQRQTMCDPETSVSDRQRRRIRRAADVWLARHPRHQACEICFDLVLVAPRRWPRHVENGL
jgi:putative endonuclease